MGMQAWNHATSKHIRIKFDPSGLDTSSVVADSDAPTGPYFKGCRPSGTSPMAYYGSGTAAFRMPTTDTGRGPLERSR